MGAESVARRRAWRGSVGLAAGVWDCRADTDHGLLLRSQLPQLRPLQYANISKRQKTVSRAYGGSRCMTCVRSR